MLDIHFRPFAAKNPTQFWQWCKPMVGRLLLRFVYRPLRYRLSRPTAMAVTFGASGFGHDFLVGLPFWLVTGQLMFPVITTMFVITSIIVSFSEYFQLDLSGHSLLERVLFHSLCLIGALGVALALGLML